MSIKNAPGLMDLDSVGMIDKDRNIIQNTDDLNQKELEAVQTKANYNREMNAKKVEITDKISQLERKLTKHTLKEGMLDKIINDTYTEMTNLSPNEFTRRGQKQSILIKQLEALGVLQDTLMKFEDMIQKYHKIILDIENNKLNSFLKITGLKTEEKEADQGLGAVLNELQTMLKSDNNSEQSIPMIEDLKQELDNDNY